MPGGAASTGTITSDGVYTAPADLPSPAGVEIRATSHADSTKFASAQVTMTSDLAVSLTPATASVELGAAQSFQAAIASNGHPDLSVRWSLVGQACPTNCGAIDATGKYTAPQILPSPASVTVLAQSVADASKQGSATVTITSHFTLTLSTPPSVMAGSSAGITATFQPAPGSNPSAALSWSLSGRVVREPRAER